MEATASVLPSDHQRRLQTRLEQNRQQFMIAFDLAQEMMVRGSHKIISDPVYQRRYGEPLLSMAFCLVQMAELHLEGAARSPPNPAERLPFCSPRFGACSRWRNGGA
jgi:hypothetical protein